MYVKMSNTITILSANYGSYNYKVHYCVIAEIDVLINCEYPWQGLDKCYRSENLISASG